MKWLCITAVCFLATLVKSGPTRSDGGPVDGTIDRIARTAKGNAGASDEFQFTLSRFPTTGIKRLLLEVHQDGMPEVPVDAEDPSKVQSPTFVADLTKYSGEEATFLITGKDESGNDIAQAHADLKPFPKFPTVVESTNLDDPRKPSEGTIIRLEGNLESMSLEKADTLIKGEVNYFSYLNAESTDVIPCKSDGDVPVCDVKLQDTKTDTKHGKI
ncbi:uncharacterized protein [Macrobrachium rosenbergii]|uniref:uncharacterized protein n=1 Tax=Macrobrachium rosenbergii TaxID=79674 RepID=UPI0034D5B9EA